MCGCGASRQVLVDSSLAVVVVVKEEMRRQDEERDGLDAWRSSERSWKGGDEMKRRGGR